MAEYKPPEDQYKMLDEWAEPPGKRREPPSTGCLLYAAAMITAVAILLGWGFIELVGWITSK